MENGKKQYFVREKASSLRVGSTLVHSEKTCWLPHLIYCLSNGFIVRLEWNNTWKCLVSIKILLAQSTQSPQPHPLPDFCWSPKWKLLVIFSWWAYLLADDCIQRWLSPIWAVDSVDVSAHRFFQDWPRLVTSGAQLLEQVARNTEGFSRGNLHWQLSSDSFSRDSSGSGKSYLFRVWKSLAELPVILHKS